jgi:hypothetical protein
MKRLILASVTLIVASLMMVVSAWAESTTTLCVPEASSKPVLSTNTKGECPTKGTKVPVKYKSVQLPGTGGLETLNKILPHITYLESGVDGKPTIQFSGVNVQVVNGERRTETTNGEGNLVIGYDENPGTQTGSHNLILGRSQTFTSFGGIVAGAADSITGEFATVSGGEHNIASGLVASVSGGVSNTASGGAASMSGGASNKAESGLSWIGGGTGNRIFEGEPPNEGIAASIFGGVGNATDIDGDAKP